MTSNFDSYDIRENMRKLIIIRRCSQFLFLSLFVYILWSMTYPLKGIFPPDAFFRFDPLINIVTSISQRVILPGVLVSLALVFLTLILGRFFCGWVCPLGTVIDMCGGKSPLVLTLFPLGKGKGAGKDLKYYILSVIVILSFIGIQIAWVFDPIVITARFVSLNFIPFVTFSIDKAVVFIIKNTHLYGSFYDFYRSLKSSFLGINLYYFPHTLRVLLFFLIICALALVVKRFWCRVVCPLGAIYAIVSKFSFLKRKVYKCTKCLKCKTECRMQAIKEDMSYEKSECILCMDCIYACPVKGTKFNFRLPLTLTLSPKGRGLMCGIIEI
jgi:polyferredoxin